ncbi:MAG: LysR family transcriptional regulator [Chordicoccus sp.]
MTLAQLEYFCAVCRYHSITRASEELFVSQPTISAAIRSLETEFHIRLFTHGKNKLLLTQEGEEFYEKAEYVVRCSQDFYSEFSLRDNYRYTIRLGIPPILSTIFLPYMLTAFQKKHDIPVRLYEYGSVRALRLVDSEELDAAIVNLDAHNTDQFNVHVMMEDRHVICLPKSHPLASQSEVTFDQLTDADVPIILYNTDSVQNQTVLSRYSALKKAPHILMNSSQLFTVLRFVKEGIAGAFLYESIPVEDDELVKIPLAPTITSQFGLVWKKGIYINHSVTHFIHFAERFSLEPEVDM